MVHELTRLFDIVRLKVAIPPKRSKTPEGKSLTRLYVFIECEEIYRFCAYLPATRLDQLRLSSVKPKWVCTKLVDVGFMWQYLPHKLEYNSPTCFTLKTDP